MIDKKKDYFYKAIICRKFCRLSKMFGNPKRRETKKKLILFFIS